MSYVASHEVKYVTGWALSTFSSFVSEFVAKPQNPSVFVLHLFYHSIP